MHQPLKVTPLEGEPYSFMVESQRPNKPPYKIELAPAVCLCWDSTTRKRKCVHIKAAIKFFCEEKAKDAYWNALKEIGETLGDYPLATRKQK